MLFKTLLQLLVYLKTPTLLQDRVGLLKLLPLSLSHSHFEGIRRVSVLSVFDSIAHLNLLLMEKKHRKLKDESFEIIDTRSKRVFEEEVIKRPSKSKKFLIPQEHGFVPYNTNILGDLLPSDESIDFKTPVKQVPIDRAKLTPIPHEQV